MKESLGDSQTFGRLLDERPEALLNACGVAILELYYEKRPLKTGIVKFAVRLLGHNVIQPFRELKAFQIGKFLTIQGNILRVSTIRPHAIQIAFQCTKCLQTMSMSTSDGVYKVPIKCQTSHCTSKNFIADHNDLLTKCINKQTIKLQEIIDIDSIEMMEEGRIPRIIDAELTCDLVDSVVPGEIVYLSGIIKALEAQTEKFASGSKAVSNSTASLYMDVIAVQRPNSKDPTTDTIAYYPARLQEIQSLAQSKDLLASLVRSFCKHIYGNEMVKLGMLLCLLGGSRRNPSGSNPIEEINVRADPHVLIVGDPGLGKSQLLRFASIVASRSVYVCANTSTAVGLTATVQDGALEAGALVLADQGICCIDEFDKIGDNWRALLDVMEQQTVNIAKAGVVCRLPARTAILAAANPVGGHYNKNKSVVENLKMDQALLSRFDLIFVLLDKPNFELDQRLSEHVLGASGTGNNTRNGLENAGNIIFQTQTKLSSDHQNSSSLQEKLIKASSKDDAIKTIDEGLLRAYISYAKAKIDPRMTEEASEVIQKHYLEMRQKRIVDETLPITTRHLESMVRLAQARAKLELRNFVTAEDANEIIELLTFAIADTLDTNGNNRSKMTVGRKGSKSGAIKRFANELIKISSNTSEIDYTQDQLKAIYDVLKISELPFRDLLDSLSEAGYLLRRSSSLFRLIVT